MGAPSFQEPVVVGEPTAWVRRHQTGLWRYLRFLGCGDALAEDILQETFVAGLECRRRGAALPGEPWLRTTARNAWFQHLRRQRRRPPEVDLAAAERVWQHNARDDGGESHRAALRACLRKLPERERLAVQLRYGEGASREAMAARLALSPEGVKSLLQRLRIALRACIENRMNRD